METIKFKKDGGPIVAEVSAGEAQTGSYDIKLWEADKNQLVFRKEGDFLNPDDDSYNLPTPNLINNGRRIQAIVVITPLPPLNQYSVALTLKQDGKIIGCIEISNKTDHQSEVLNIYAILKPEEE
jgi:hypothetical protein